MHDCVHAHVCVCVCVCVSVCVCASDKPVSGAGSCLWPIAMVKFAPHWHAVKCAGIIGIAIIAIGYFYLHSMPWSVCIAGHSLNIIFSRKTTLLHIYLLNWMCH